MTAPAARHVRRLTLAGSAVLLLATLLPAAPAAASPEAEAAMLTSMQSAWAGLSRKDKRQTCAAYRVDPRGLVAASVDTIWADETQREGLTRPEWRRVIRGYLAWACSGPGTTPR